MVKLSGSEAVDAYLAGCEPGFRSLLEALRATIRRAAPDAEECIAYGIPTFRLGGNLVHYAAFKRHCSFFPGRAALLAEFADRLGGYKLAKGTIQFTADNPLPDDLVELIVRKRITENQMISGARSRKGGKGGTRA
jgi:uncharacterized protein YdhG (YjbR/CyaY superfamily)